MNSNMDGSNQYYSQQGHEGNRPPSSQHHYHEDDEYYSFLPRLQYQYHEKDHPSHYQYYGHTPRPQCPQPYCTPYSQYPQHYNTSRPQYSQHSSYSPYSQYEEDLLPRPQKDKATTPVMDQESAAEDVTVEETEEILLTSSSQK